MDLRILKTTPAIAQNPMLRNERSINSFANQSIDQPHNISEVATSRED
jgi:hypothetical protein